MGKNIGSVTIKLKANGTDYADTSVLSLAIFHAVNTISSAEISLFDGDISKQEYTISGDANFAPGMEMEISIGHGPEVEPLFKGIIVRHQIKSSSKGGTSLHLEIKHKAVKMSHIRKTRHFLDKKDSDIIETLINDSGASPEVDSDFEVEHERMIQYNITDWDFMVLRAEANGKVVFIDEDKVVVGTPKIKSAKEPYAKLGDNVYEFEAEVETRDQFKAGSAISWDHSSQEILDQKAKDASAKAPGEPASSKLAESMGPAEFRLRHPGELGDNELVAWSTGKLLRSSLSKLRGRIQLLGDAKLKVGGTIKLEGFSKTFNGDGFIGAVRHSVSHGIWLSDVELGLDQESHAEKVPTVFEPAASGLLAPMRGLQIGVVKEIKGDPQSFFRVQVKMPTVDDSEDGIWCRVARPDAGASHTVFWQPQVGDEVVLGFLNEDPRHAIVLGSLHNTDANKPPIEGNDEYKKRGIVTPEGLKLTFNDEDISVILETPKGKKITVDEKEGVIRLEDELNNKIEMSKDGILIESGKDIIIKATGDVKVDGVNIEQSAQAQFKAEGTAGIEVSSSANAVLKGAMVQIN
jgi:Rhs element Vgr protein